MCEIHVHTCISHMIFTHNHTISTIHVYGAYSVIIIWNNSTGHLHAHINYTGKWQCNHNNYTNNILIIIY